MITYGSVCSGIEAASVAWEPLGFKPEWFSEVEAFPKAVLAHRWPTVTDYGDMCNLPNAVRAGWITTPDILVGGTPCQGLSVAGKRGGLEDPRGQLTLKYVELADAIDEQRQGNECVTVWENVPGVLNIADNAFGHFITALSGETCELKPPGGRWTNAGYVLGPQRTVAWRVLDAQYFGVAQRRRRVFVVASARDGFDPRTVLFECEGARRDTAPSRETGQETTADVRVCTEGSFGGYADGIGTVRASGGAVGGGSENLVVNRLRGFGDYVEAGISSTLQSRDYKGATDLVVSAGFLGNNSARARSIGYEEEVSPSLRTDAKVHVIHGGQDPIHRAELMHAIGSADRGGANVVVRSFAQNSRSELRYTGGGGQVVGAITASGTAKPGQGNPCIAVIPIEARADRNWVPGQGEGDRIGKDGDPCATLTSQDRHIVGTLCANGVATCGPTCDEAAAGHLLPVTCDGSTLTPWDGQALRVHSEHGNISTLGGGSQKSGIGNCARALLSKGTVRRLTETECLRLQGFPDGHTQIPWKGKPAEECPGGHQYRAIGNSKAVPVVRWLGKRLAEALA